MYPNSVANWIWKPLGDASLLAACRSEEEASQLAKALRTFTASWRQDVVQAYSSVAIFFDLQQIDIIQVQQSLEKLKVTAGAKNADERLHIIPCCYEMGQDVARISDATGLAYEEIIRLHQETTYTVYAIGFCPGFPYLGYLSLPLQGVPRLATPRLQVEVGSVGLTGKQTGIYTEARPGGWNIVGRTPIELVDVGDGYFPLRTGDRVKFRRIDEKEFVELRGERI